MHATCQAVEEEPSVPMVNFSEMPSLIMEIVLSLPLTRIASNVHKNLLALFARVMVKTRVTEKEIEK